MQEFRVPVDDNEDIIAREIDTGVELVYNDRGQDIHVCYLEEDEGIRASLYLEYQDEGISIFPLTILKDDDYNPYLNPMFDANHVIVEKSRVKNAIDILNRYLKDLESLS